MKKIKHFIHMTIRRFFLSRPYSAIFGPFFVLKPRLFGNSKRLTVSNRATVNNAFFNTLGGKIEIEDDVFFGQNVSILTGSHDFTKFGEDRFKAEVTEGNDILIKKAPG
ncbi:MAG: hypothetical protein Q7S53_00200 [bacterium]|nr:hypothetical protein [bacterium]